MDVARLLAQVLTPIVYPFYRLHYKYKSYLKHRSMRKNIERLQIANGTSFEGLAATEVGKRLKVVSRKQELCKAVEDAWKDLEDLVPRRTLDYL